MAGFKLHPPSVLANQQLAHIGSNVSLSNLQVLNAVLYVAEQGCEWAWLAEALRPLVYRLYADEPMVHERRSGSCF
jgi:hypothetical protein